MALRRFDTSLLAAAYPVGRPYCRRQAENEMFSEPLTQIISPVFDLPKSRWVSPLLTTFLSFSQQSQSEDLVTEVQLMLTDRETLCLAQR